MHLADPLKSVPLKCIPKVTSKRALIFTKLCCVLQFSLNACSLIAFYIFLSSQAKFVPQRRLMVSARFLKPIRDPCPILYV